MPSIPADEYADRRLKIAHLYPDAMDLYGDIGNVLTLVKRCQWRGIGVEVAEVRVGEPADLSDSDIIVMGGGQDTAQAFVAADLVRRGPAIRSVVDGGAAALVVCGGFQLFGLSYTTSAGSELPGIGVFDARTFAGKERFIGNVVVEARLGHAGSQHTESAMEIVGFENHSGLTYLGVLARPLGSVVMGAGNTGDGTVEGAVFKNAIGTYLHGPLLPKNPGLADYLITSGLTHRYGTVEPLESLDDLLEIRAHRVAVRRCDSGRVARIREPLAG